MDKALQERLLAEAIWIGDHLADRAKISTVGIVWDTISNCDTEGNVFWDQNPGIYGGVSGILLFYTKLFQHTNDTKYLDIIAKGLVWVEDYCQSNHLSYSLYYGRLGVAYMLTELYRVTEDTDFLTKADSLTEGLEKDIENNAIGFELAGGVSGVIIGLLHLYHHSKNNNLLDKIALCTQYLIDHAAYSDKGVYWGNYRDTIRGLCGFSHGNAGIAFTLLELASFSQNSAFAWLAEQAIAYENFYFDPEKNSWPDFRKNINWLYEIGKYKDVVYNKDASFYFTPSNLLTWGHGAPGIALSRLNTLNRSNSRGEDIEAAIQAMNQGYHSAKNKKEASYTLDYGFGGFVIITSQLTKSLSPKQNTKYVNDIVRNALSQREELGFYFSGFRSNTNAEDFSLFMGTAGVGYMYLSLLDTENDRSILYPSVSKTDAGSIEALLSGGAMAMDQQEMIVKVLADMYPKTIAYYQRKVGEVSFGAEKGISDISMSNLIEEAKVDDNIYSRLHSVHYLESEKYTLRHATQSNAYAYLRYLVVQDNNEALLDNDGLLLKSTLYVVPETTLVELKWNIVGDNWLENLDSAPSKHSILLHKNDHTVAEYSLNTFNDVLIRSFKLPVKVSKVIAQLAAEYNHDDQKTVADAILNQVKELLSVGVLTGKVNNRRLFKSLFSF